MFGHKECKVYHWKDHEPWLEELFTLRLGDSVKDCAYFYANEDQDTLLVGLAHNAIEHYGIKHGQAPKLSHTVQCQYVSLLYSMAISMAGLGDGRRLVLSGTCMWKIILWDAQGSGTPLSVLSQHQGAIMGVRWAKDGNHFASVSDDRTLRLWNVAESSVSEETKHEGIKVEEVRCGAHSPAEYANLWIEMASFWPYCQDLGCRFPVFRR